MFFESYFFDIFFDGYFEPTGQADNENSIVSIVVANDNEMLVLISNENEFDMEISEDNAFTIEVGG